MNYLDVQELGVVNPDVTQGRTRFRDDFRWKNGSSKRSWLI